MTMVKTNTNGSQARSDIFSNVVYFVKRCSLSRQCTSNLVHKHSTRQASAPDDFALSAADGDVIAHDDEPNLVGFVWVYGSVLFCCETKVQDISGVVSSSTSAYEGRFRQSCLLYDDHSSGSR